MKVAFYGNNLNEGYFFVQMLNERGIEAHLFMPVYAYQQEQHGWWTNQAAKQERVTIIQHPGELLWVLPRLTLLPAIRKLYAQVQAFDVLIMVEDGPALFSELSGIKKIFFPLGYDINVLPFAVKTFLVPSTYLRQVRQHLRQHNLRAVLIDGMDTLRYPLLQRRQRRGIRQADAIINYSGHHEPLLKRLSIDEKKSIYLPFPMETDSYLAEINPTLIAELQQQYAEVDLVFFHPTRQLYLHLDANDYLKDNDKLLRAFAYFVRQTSKKVKLLLLEKGRDLAAAKALVKQLELEEWVEWLPEMPNHRLRAYYQLPQVIVCDQFSPHLSQGNIFREASFHGCPIIITFNPEWAALLYGQDLPPHVFAAHTEDAILTAMHELENISQLQELRQAGAAWFMRHLHKDILIPRYIEFIQNVAAPPT